MTVAEALALLELPPGAGRREIKRARRRLLKQCHPDVNQAHDAEDRTRAILEAAELLLAFDADAPARPARPPRSKVPRAAVVAAYNQMHHRLRSVLALQTAKEAGLSTQQKHQALRVSAVPAPDFEAAVESETPAGARS